MIVSPYTVSLDWLPNAGKPYHRMAKVGSKDAGLPEIICVTPPEFDHGIPHHWNPEHLFVASSVSCFFTTFLKMSEGSNLSLSSLHLSGTGVLDMNEENKKIVKRIDIKIDLTVTRKADVSKARRVVEKAKDDCLISNSIKTLVVVEPSIGVQD